MKLFYSNVFKNYFLITMSLFISEMIFRLIIGYSILEMSVLRIFLGANIFGLLLSTIFSLTGRIIGNTLSFLASLFGALYAIIQVGFYNYLGVFISINSLSEINNVSEYLLNFIKSFEWNYFLILIPCFFELLFYLFVDNKIKIMESNDNINFADKFDSEERKKLDASYLKKNRRKKALNEKINGFAISIIFIVIYAFLLNADFMQNKYSLRSASELFSMTDLPSASINQFGCTMYLQSEIGLSLKNSLKDIIGSFSQSIKTKLENSLKIETKYDTEYEKTEQVESDFTRYLDDTIWDEITSSETNSDYKTLNNYFISQEITDENDYTGLFKDKNLIVIMVDSLNEIILNEEYYPNLYKLSNEGWYFENSYSKKSACSTGNNEFSGITSLYAINNECTMNSYSTNTYPESIFNLFSNASYNTSSYHNYTDKYYNRSIFHTNAGSGHYYGVQELGIPYSNSYGQWASDIELINKYLSLTENKTKTMAWITTSSTLGPYNESSELGDLYLDTFKTGSTSLNRYMSKLKVLDDAIGTLLEGLEKQNKLDDTVIVIYSSHTPNGLDTSSVNKQLNYDTTTEKNIDKTPFIIYNTEIQAQVFKEYTSNVDIIPTLANLFDLDYDPRLYVGHDILSKTDDNRVIFQDGSWKDEKGYYDSATGTITYYDKNNSYTDEELEEINETVNEKIYMSSLAIKTNYFKYLYAKEEEAKVKPVSEDTDNT